MIRMRAADGAIAWIFLILLAAVDLMLYCEIFWTFPREKQSRQLALIISSGYCIQNRTQGAAELREHV